MHDSREVFHSPADLSNTFSRRDLWREELSEQHDKVAHSGNKALPACREFVVQGLFDWVSRGLIPNEEVTKSTVLGTSTARGLVQLFQLKKQCLDFRCSSMMARAKIVEADREILQRVLSNHES